MSIATGPWIGDKEDIDGPKDEAGSVGVFHQELFEMQGEADSLAPGAEKIGAPMAWSSFCRTRRHCSPRSRSSSTMEAWSRPARFPWGLDE